MIILTSALILLEVKDWLPPVATVAAACIALIGVSVTARQAKRSARAAERSADAAQTSAKAATTGANAARESVGVNRDTAAGVARRAEADSLAKRYQEAASQLGHEKAAVRLAGAYAMGSLADDWTAQRQQCVDVLCAYVRMPSRHETIEGRASEEKVREAILKMIGAHLDARLPNNWCDREFDFSDATIDSLNWRDVTFMRTPRFSGIKVHGSFSLNNGTFKKGGVFWFSEFCGLTMIQSTTVEGSSGLQFANTTFADCVFTSEYVAPDSIVNFSNSTIQQRLHVTCAPSEAEQGQLGLTNVVVLEDGRIELDAVDEDDSWLPSRHCVSSAPHSEITLGAAAKANLPKTFVETIDTNGLKNWKKQ